MQRQLTDCLPYALRMDMENMNIQLSKDDYIKTIEGRKHKIFNRCNTRGVVVQYVEPMEERSSV
jgi:hypothetical protein